MKYLYKIPDDCSRGYAEVNVDAIVDNMKNMKAVLKKDTKMIGIIKTDGYGHGSVPIAKALEPLDFMWGFAVATPEEAHDLRKEGMQNLQMKTLWIGEVDEEEEEEEGRRWW